MGLVLKHVERTKSGSLQYRRRVPKDVSANITKREFKRKLGDSEREALAAYPAYHAQVEREIEAARRKAGSAGAAPATDLEAYTLARQQVRDMAASGFTRGDMQSAAEGIISRYPLDPETDTPIDASLIDAYAINLLRGGRAEPAAPEPSLNDALGLYCREHLRADHPETDSRVVGLAKRVVGSAIAAMGRDPRLSSITREDARNIRDHMLDRIKETGRGVGGKVSASTVSRELSIVAAVFNFAVREFGLPATVQNPFSNLPVARVAKGKGQKASEKRDPLPADVLKETRARVLDNGSPELAFIWRLIEGTGCRIAEVTGLRVEDVSPDGEFPFVRIEPNAVRSLKTESSRRVVPLVGDALGAAKEALKLPRQGDMLFPSYGRQRGSDAASASLMKHMRKVSVDEKHVIHSLRHNMKDRLILVEASALDQNLILGHAMGSVGDRVYGGEVARLRATTRAMQRAFGLMGTPK